jgi:hypothetical protein
MPENDQDVTPADTGDNPELAELLAKGMSYGELNDTLAGISLSISGDMMLFGVGKTARNHLADAIARIQANEASVRGVSEEEVFVSPPETMLDPSSITIFAEACDAIEKAGRG